MQRGLAQVFRDIETTGAPLPRVEDSDWQTSPGKESAFLRSEDGSGMGIWVDPDLPVNDQLAMLADQVQEWLIEELWQRGQPTNWPRCPEHPDNHPLTAAVRRGRATWACPSSEGSASEIGSLSPLH